MSKKYNISSEQIKEITEARKTIKDKTVDRRLRAVQLVEFKERWQKTYPSCVKSWEDNWDILSIFYAYPAEVRKIIYTTNIIRDLSGIYFILSEYTDAGLPF